MRQILTFAVLFVFGVINSQHYVELRLIDVNVGTPAFNSTAVPTESNDAGMNAILAGYAVAGYEFKGGHPAQFPIINITCYGDVQGLIADLNEYTSVVESAQEYPPGEFPDAVYVGLTPDNLGGQIGQDANGNVLTNDVCLNDIFQSFNVYHFGYTTSNTYSLACNCDKVELTNALLNCPTIADINNIPAVYQLNSHEFRYENIMIAPNPFEQSFQISGGSSIKAYTLFDLRGVSVIKTESITKLEGQVSALASGMYILELEMTSGNIHVERIVKK